MYISSSFSASDTRYFYCYQRLEKIANEKNPGIGETVLGVRGSKKTVHILLKTLPFTLALFSEMFRGNC